MKLQVLLKLWHAIYALALFKNSKLNKVKLFYKEEIKIRTTKAAISLNGQQRN